jgi:peptidoglycan/xylan/chitin deacetylase (PgdA/CDA1 family)
MDPVNIPVLMLHGLCARIPDYAQFGGSRTCLLPGDDFRALVAWCCKEFDVIRASQLDAIMSGSLKVRRPLLLTFDDALASMIDIGVPVLRERGISALAFVTTDWTDSGRAPFIFRLERLLFDAPPKQLEITAGEPRLIIPIGSKAALPRALDTLWSELFARKVSPSHLRAEDVTCDGRPVIDEVRGDDRDFWGPATWAELSAAAAASTIEIGSHMRSHRPLTWLDESELEDELAGSRAVLAGRFGAGVTCCSYPHGLVDDRGRRVAERAFRWSFSNRGGMLNAASSRTAAPRIHVPGEHWRRVKLPIRFPRLMRAFGR